MSIRTLLVANRGEIAVRIIRFAYDSGMRSIAVYSDLDRGAPHTLAADVAVHLPGETASETYLDGARIIDAALAHGADAVHPGYGFLSENADFAEAVGAAGLTWVGPNTQAIRTMGDKLAAKRLAAEVGIPLLPSSELAGDAPFEWRTQAATVGYPLMVKAAAGGGGRGMRLVMSEGDLEDAVESARREALASFGDATVFAERWLASPRHVEIQIAADKFGAVVHLGERECSIQRRHQKLIEEAPSPALDDLLREQMALAAVRLAEAIGYDSIGTVEFLLDVESGRFYFLEMNTRLQVEYRVTELVAGVDLLHTQVSVADGEPLPFAQDDLELQNHAIEARLVAEDPSADWLPSTGTIHRFWAPEHPNVIVDHAIGEGRPLAAHYDSLLAKVIAFGTTRRQAAQILSNHLLGLQLHGVASNRDHLVAVLRSDDFLEGNTTTAFLDLHLTLLDAGTGPSTVTTHVLAATLSRQHNNRSVDRHWRPAPSGWRNLRSDGQRVAFEAQGEIHSVDYRVETDGSYSATVDGQPFTGRVIEAEEGLILIEIEGTSVVCWVHQVDDRYYVNSSSGQTDLVEVPRFPDRSSKLEAGGPTAPVPGRVVAVEVSVGDVVVAGQTLVVMEAMKVEHRVTAAVDARVVEVLAPVGENVEAHQLLVRLEENL
jgi:acetyl/propionyl-CoA carboxylase alpha subunit